MALYRELPSNVYEHATVIGLKVWTKNLFIHYNTLCMQGLFHLNIP